MDREDFDAVYLIDPVSIGAERGRPAEPLDEMPHLVGESVTVSHARNNAERAVVENALRGPEGGAGDGWRAIAVDGVEEFVGDDLIRIVERLGEIFRDVIGKRGSEEFRLAAADEAGETGIESRSVIVRPGPGVGIFCPLQRGGERGSDVKCERRVVGLVCLEHPEITRRAAGGFIIHQVLNDTGRLDRLVSVCEEHDFGTFAAVIRARSAEVTRHLSIEADVVLVFPVIGCQPVVANDVTDVIPTADVARACRRGVPCAVARGEDLEV